MPGMGAEQKRNCKINHSISFLKMKENNTNSNDTQLLHLCLTWVMFSAYNTDHGEIEVGHR